MIVISIMKELKLKMNELTIKYIVNGITLLGTDILGEILRTQLRVTCREEKVGMQREWIFKPFVASATKNEFHRALYKNVQKDL